MTGLTSRLLRAPAFRRAPSLGRCELFYSLDQHLGFVEKRWASRRNHHLLRRECPDRPERLDRLADHPERRPSLFDVGMAGLKGRIELASPPTRGSTRVGLSRGPVSTLRFH